MGDWCEGATVLFLILSTGKFLLNVVGNKLLSFNLRDLGGSLNFTLEKQLLLEELGESGVKRVGPGGQAIHHILFVIIKILREDLCLFSALAIGEKLVNLLNQILVGSYIVKQPLRDEHAPVVFTLVSSVHHDIADSINDVNESLTAMCAFLRDNDHIRVSLHGAFEDQVGGVAAHESDEVPVLDGGSAVRKHVANKLRVDLGGRVEANRRGDEAMADVSIHGGRDSHHRGVNAVGQEVLGECAAVRHGVRRTDHYQAVQAKFLAHLSCLLLLAVGSEEVVGTAEVVVAAQVPEGLERFFVDLHHVLIDEALQTVDETDQLHILARGLIPQETVNDIVTAGGLLPKIDDTDFESLLIGY